MSIRRKILIPMAVVATVCAAVIGLLGVYVVNLFVGDFNEDQLAKAYALASTAIEDYKKNAGRISTTAAENDQLITDLQNYLAGGERKPLIDSAVSLMEASGVDYLTVLDTNGTVLVRTLEPDRFGDSLTYQSNVKNALQGNQYTTLEEGSVVKLSAVCGTPIYDQNKRLIGVVSLGYRLDQSTFVDYVKHLTNTEVTVFLGDTRMSTTITNEKGERAVGTQVSKDVSSQVLGGNNYIGQTTVFGKKLLADYSPLRDAEGSVLGMLFIGLDTSAIDARMVQDTWIMVGVVSLLGILSIFISRMISSRISRPIEDMSNAAKRIAAGDLDTSIRKNTKDEIGELSNIFGDVVDIFSLLMERIDRTYSLLTDGELDVAIDENMFPGDYKKAVSTINSIVKYLDDNTWDAINCMKEYGNGNFDAKIRRFKKKQAVLHETMDALQDNLKSVNREIGKLIKDAVAGNLDTRIDSSNYNGDWRVITDGLNKLLEAVDTPISEVSQVLSRVADANYDVSVQGDYKGRFEEMKVAVNNTVKNTAEYIQDIRDILLKMSNQELDFSITKTYKGDFKIIKDALIQIVDTFNKLIGEFTASAEQVAVGSNQISESSISLAQGASEQASSAQELSATIESISHQTSQNAENSDKVNILSLKAKENGIASEQEMEKMLKSMHDIEEASVNISKITKVIDELAFQTNLLALNAAVEAARAGEHGKGFTVVAEEVRNLAGRSKRAASEIAELIDNTGEIITEGTQIANSTAHSLSNIVEQITEVAAIIDNVSTASKEQDIAISQIKEGIVQISDVIQANASISEESASSSQELSSQAELFRSALSQFSLRS